MFFSTQQTTAVLNKQIFPPPLQDAAFSFRNEAMEAMGAMEGTV